MNPLKEAHTASTINGVHGLQKNCPPMDILVEWCRVGGKNKRGEDSVVWCGGVVVEDKVGEGEASHPLRPYTTTALAGCGSIRLLCLTVVSRTRDRVAPYPPETPCDLSGLLSPAEGGVVRVERLADLSRLEAGTPWPIAAPHSCADHGVVEVVGFSEEEFVELEHEGAEATRVAGRHLDEVEMHGIEEIGPCKRPKKVVCLCVVLTLFKSRWSSKRPTILAPRHLCKRKNINTDRVQLSYDELEAPVNHNSL